MDEIQSTQGNTSQSPCVLKLQMKFFDSIISPAVRFGLATVPLSTTQFSTLDIVRKRMLRSIVGWAPVVNGDWHDAMSSNLSNEIMA